MTQSSERALPHEHWYYLAGDKHLGPVTREFLQKSLNDGSLDGSTFVWREGLSTWVKADACTFLTSGLKQTPVIPPPAVLEHQEKAQASPPVNSHPPVVDAAVPYAGLHWRLLAGLIDCVVMILPVWLGLIVLQAVLGANEPLEWLCIILVWWCYYAVLHASSWQATVGMKLLKLRITDRVGGRIDFGRATGRYFASLISSVFCYLGFLIIPFTPKRQGFHGLVAGTLVIRQR